MCCVDVVLILELLDADLQAVLGEDEVLGLHFVASGFGDLLADYIEVIGDEGECEEDDEENYEGDCPTGKC